MVTPLSEAEAAQVERVFDAHGGFIETVARRHTRYPQDIPDVVQAVGVQVCRKLSGFRGDAGITTWLYRVTVNAAIDLWRMERRQARVRESLLSSRRGEVRTSGAFVPHEDGPFTDPALAAERSHRVPIHQDGVCYPTQVDEILRTQRAQALREGIARLPERESDRLRDELQDPTVSPHSRQNRHRARLRLREVLAADPRFA